jgi:hypothetical protein
MPDPGEELISRVAGGTDRAWFFWSGRESVRELERTLAIAGRSLDRALAMLKRESASGVRWLTQRRKGSCRRRRSDHARSHTDCGSMVPSSARESAVAQ